MKGLFYALFCVFFLAIWCVVSTHLKNRNKGTRNLNGKHSGAKA